MKKTPLIIIAVVAVVAVLFGIIAVSGKEDSMTANNATGTSMSSDMANSDTLMPSAVDAVMTDKVSIEDYKFGPEAIKVKVGTTVTWTNNDSVRHNVAGVNNDLPEGELIGRGESYSYTFTKAGTFDYICTPHPYMKGTVIVE